MIVWHDIMYYLRLVYQKNIQFLSNGNAINKINGHISDGFGYSNPRNGY